MASQPPQATLHSGIVKQVLSGDTVVVRGQPHGGPPKERTICLTNVIAPRLARRANPNIEGSTETQDEPCAWESREFLRKKIIGKEVTFTVEYQVPGSGREYGYIYIGKDQDAENVTESLVAEGLLEVRRGGIRLNEDGQSPLVQLEEAARAAGKGKWAPNAKDRVRNISWTLENPRNFLDTHKKPVDAIIEHVRDACTVRAFILPTFQHVTIMMTGIKGPMFKMENNTTVPEEYADEAKFFTESRLLQRELKVLLEGESNQNLLGTVYHPNGNIQEILVAEGFARCVDWSIGLVTEGREKLRAAEKKAKEKKIRLWKNYVPSANKVDIKDKSFSAKVVEVVNGDALVVRPNDKPDMKIFLASVRPPRQTADPEEKKDPKTRTRPLYDIPYMFEAREFLRKKVLGKKVNINIDYVQPASQGFPEKTCCTVTLSGIDLGEALIGKGLARAIRYRQDDDQRSSHYDELLAAESRAMKKTVGVHSKKDKAPLRVADVSGDVNKAKQFLPFLQRAGRMEGVVEFVASGSRIRLYIPRETCLITFLLSGITCPKGTRPIAGGIGEFPAEPFGNEAQAFTKNLVMQREVEVEIETMDKGGNFIGYMFLDGVNISVALVTAGLASMHFTAERGNYYKSLSTEESIAKETKLKLWANYEEPKEVIPENEPTERKVNYKTVIVTEIKETANFFVQNVDTGPELEKLMDELRSEMTNNPPLEGSLTPKRGTLVAAKFEDGNWYRAKIEKVETNGNIHLIYIDYGNTEVSNSKRIAALPTKFTLLSAQATEYGLACVALPPEADDVKDFIDALHSDILNRQLKLNTEYRSNGMEYVTLQNPETQDDVIQTLVGDGLVLVEQHREKRLQKLMANYNKAQEKAKTARVNIWRYGDFRADDTKEFGYQA